MGEDDDEFLLIKTSFLKLFLIKINIFFFIFRRLFFKIYKLFFNFLNVMSDA